jgi:hypothetical protein
MPNSIKEYRIFQCYTLKADSANGIIESYVSIGGIPDLGFHRDVVEPGAFKKTIAERGPLGAKKIRVLWQHELKSVIGLPLLLEEHSRDQLPEKIRRDWPTASMGLFARSQIVMDVQQGREAFALYRAGAMDEWSIGFNDLTNDGNGDFIKDGDNSFRHLREVRLWEYSPVTWGMNEATTTIMVKTDGRDQSQSDSAEPKKSLTAKDYLIAAQWMRLNLLERRLQIKLKGGSDGKFESR